MVIKQLKDLEKGFNNAGKKVKKDKKEPKLPPKVGKVQAEIVSALYGKDHFKNRSFNFEFKLLTGPDTGRDLTKEVSLEYKKSGEDDKTVWVGSTETTEGELTDKQVKEKNEDALEKAYKFLSNFGVETLDRDAVEGLEGSIVEINLWKHSSAPDTRYPTIYASKMITPAGEEAGEDKPEGASNDDDDEYEDDLEEEK